MSAPNGFDTERATLATAFFNGFKVAGAAPFPVVAENQPSPKVADNALWGRFSVRPGTGTAAEIGTVMRRNVGVAYLQVFAPMDGGTKPALDALDLFASTFDFARLPLPGGVGVIECEVSSVTNVGVDTASGRFQVNASVEYERTTFVPQLVPA